MASNSVKAKCSDAYANAEPSSVRNHFEGVETRRRPSKCSDAYDEGIVQGVMKVTQTRILWSTVQVRDALPFTRSHLLRWLFRCCLLTCRPHESKVSPWTDLISWMDSICKQALGASRVNGLISLDLLPQRPFIWRQSFFIASDRFKLGGIGHDTQLPNLRDQHFVVLNGMF